MHKDLGLNHILYIREGCKFLRHESDGELLNKKSFRKKFCDHNSTARLYYCMCVCEVLGGGGVHL